MEYGELNQTTLLSCTGLNLAKHRDILEDMEEKGLIKRTEESWGIKFSHSFVSEISYKLKKPGCCKHI